MASQPKGAPAPTSSTSHAYEFIAELEPITYAAGITPTAGTSNPESGGASRVRLMSRILSHQLTS